MELVEAAGQDSGHRHWLWLLLPQHWLFGVCVVVVVGLEMFSARLDARQHVFLSEWPGAVGTATDREPYVENVSQELSAIAHADEQSHLNKIESKTNKKQKKHRHNVHKSGRSDIKQSSKILRKGDNLVIDYKEATTVTAEGSTATDRTRDRTIDEANAGTTKYTKLILYWNTFFGAEDFTLGIGQAPFERHKCPVSGCETTSDKSRFWEADAVLFHFVPGCNLQTIPTRARPDQIYVFFLFETPLQIFTASRNLSEYGGIFNLTMTYRRDSDIWIPHGVAEALPASGSIRRDLAGSLRQLLQKKAKLIAWVVSNCRGHSRRMDYVHELSKYVPVDIYGACGTYECSGRVHADSCFPKIYEEYKFYLSFENSVCRDYMTEKLFRPLTHGVVPIVLGGGNYSQSIPSHSYINIRDFDSPRQLAKHIRYLSRNDDEYLKYFRWTSDWYIRGLGWTRPRGFCRLCEIMNDPAYRFRSGFDLKRWWQDGGECLSGEDLGEWLRMSNWRR